MVGRRFQIGAEGLDVRAGSAAGQGGELRLRHEPASAPQRNELADRVAVAGNSECLPVLDGVHDLPGPVPQVTLGNLRLR